MALSTCKLWSNGIKIASFFHKKLHSGWGLSLQTIPTPPPVMGLSYTSLLNTSPNLHFCTLYFWFKSSNNSKILVTYKHTGHGFWSSNLQYRCPTKSFSFKNFWRRHYLWFGTPNQKSWLHLCPWSYMHSYNWLFSWQNKNLDGISSSGLLFTTII